MNLARVRMSPRPSTTARVLDSFENRGILKEFDLQTNHLKNQYLNPIKRTQSAHINDENAL